MKDSPLVIAAAAVGSVAVGLILGLSWTYSPALGGGVTLAGLFALAYAVNIKD